MCIPGHFYPGLFPLKTVKERAIPEAVKSKEDTVICIAWGDLINIETLM